MIGRWVSPIEHDRTCLVVSGCLLETTERWGPASGHFEQRVRSQNVLMAVEIGRSTFEAGDTWRASHDRTLGSYV